MMFNANPGRGLGFGRSAITLVESIVSMTIVGVMLVAALNTVGAARLVQSTELQRQRAYTFAQALLSEIMNQAFEDSADTLNLPGPTAAEAATGNRSLFNDVNDYTGWTASPPQRKDGSAVPDSTGWRETVNIKFLNPATFKDTGGQNLGIVQITVQMSNRGGVVAELTALRARGISTPQACCMPNGACRMFPPTDCTASGGTPLGAGSSCWAQDCGDGLVGYWKMENNGLVAVDSACNHNGVLINGPTYVSAPSGSGNALQFDGTDDYIEIPHDSMLSITSGLTISLWLYKETNTGTDVIISKGSTGTNHNYYLCTVGNALTFGFYNGQQYEYQCATTIAQRTWTEVAVTYNDFSDTVQFYTNGQLRDTNTCNASLTTNKEPLFIGRAVALNMFHGRIDNLRLYRRALAADEIAELFNADNE